MFPSFPCGSAEDSVRVKTAFINKNLNTDTAESSRVQDACLSERGAGPRPSGDAFRGRAESRRIHTNPNVVNIYE